MPVVSTTGGSGGYAERAAAADPIEVPEGVSLADATALLADGRTAIGLMEGAGVRPGDVVLVEAAAGGVGGLLVQLARTAGARVIGASSKPEAVQRRGARRLHAARLVATVSRSTSCSTASAARSAAPRSRPCAPAGG